MTGFPLLALHPVILEKVIAKLQEKSYFRLNQTCWCLREFIENNQNISVYLDDYCFLGDIGASRLRGVFKYKSVFELDRLYGVRIATLVLYESKLKQDFGNLCTALRKYRITCAALCATELEFDVEQCATLIKILKPRTISMNSELSNRFEALLQPNKLKEVRIRLDISGMPIIIPKLLFLFPEVHVSLPYRADLFTSLPTLLKILYSATISHLRKFGITIYGVRSPSEKKLQEHLHEFNPTIKVNNGARGKSVLITMPFSSGFSCSVVIKCGSYLELKFCKTELVSLLCLPANE